MRLILILATAAALAGCATHFENTASQPGAKNAERRSLDVSRADRPQILVGISGGGSRAADLGWVILRDLGRYQYRADGQSRRLIDDVAIVSSVSGGSVIAAYFGLYGPERLDRFESEFLVQDNMATLGLDAANPITWMKLAVTGASRINVLEELFDQRLFHGEFLAALNQPGKPFVILNATDMASGEVFAFTPSRFDDICSDFDKERLSVGVAASAAFPIALSPVAFQNYSATVCRGQPVPLWITAHMTGRFGPYLNVEEYKRARYANDLRHGENAFRDIQYLYFLDGGLADNAGGHSLLTEIASPEGISGLVHRLNVGQVKRVVVLLINARSDPAQSSYTSDSRPGIVEMVKSVTSVPIDATTASVNSQMDVLVEQVRQAAKDAPPDALFGGLKVYSIQIDFDQLRSSDAEQRTLRDQVKEIPTTWTISQKDRETINKAGTLLLHQHPCFQRLLLDLKVQASFVDPAYAEAGCVP